MEITGDKSRLRLVMITGDNVRPERVFPRCNPNMDLVDVIAARLKSIAEETETEWKARPGSVEHGDEFHPLSHRLKYLERFSR